MISSDFDIRLTKIAKELLKQLKSLPNMDHAKNFIWIYEQLTNMAVHCQRIKVTTLVELLNIWLKYYLAKLYRKYYPTVNRERNYKFI